MIGQQFKNLLFKRSIMASKTNLSTPLMQNVRRNFSAKQVGGGGPSMLAGGAAAFATFGITMLCYKGHQTRM